MSDLYKYKFWFKGSSPEGTRLNGYGSVYAESGAEAFEKAEAVAKITFPTIILDGMGGIKTRLLSRKPATQTAKLQEGGK